jgi:hypothetical protein
MNNLIPYNPNNDEEYLDLVPSDLKTELVKLLRSSLSLRERWEIAKERANAVANKRMVMADFLIEEGLIKRRFSKKE